MRQFLGFFNEKHVVLRARYCVFGKDGKEKNEKRRAESCIVKVDTTKSEW